MSAKKTSTVSLLLANYCANMAPCSTHTLAINTQETWPSLPLGSQEHCHIWLQTVSIRIHSVFKTSQNGNIYRCPPAMECDEMLQNVTLYPVFASQNSNHEQEYANHWARSPWHRPEPALKRPQFNKVSCTADIPAMSLPWPRPWLVERAGRMGGNPGAGLPARIVRLDHGRHSLAATLEERP